MKPKLTVYLRTGSGCGRHRDIYTSTFELKTVQTEEDLLIQVHNSPTDAIVTCCCTAGGNDVLDLRRLGALVWPVPVIACVRRFTPGFVRYAAGCGLDRLVFCDLEADIIGDLITGVLQRGALGDFLESCWPGCRNASPYMRRLIDEIIRAAPKSPKVEALSVSLAISRDWLHKLCKRTFGMPLKPFLRCLRVYQMLRLLQRADFDNADIACLMKYKEESHMARDCRKTLGYNPREARMRLLRRSPQELIGSAIAASRKESVSKLRDANISKKSLANSIQMEREVDMVI